MLDILQVCNIGKCTVQELATAVTTFLAACQDAGWKANFIPKFHWLLHLASHYQRFGMLPMCWVHERKHKTAKRYASNILNTKGYENSMINQVVSHNLAALERPDVFDLHVALMQPNEPNASLHGFGERLLGMTFSSSELLVSSRARIIPAGFVTRGDVVIAASHAHPEEFIAGEVMILFKAMGSPLCLLNAYAPGNFDANEGTCEWITSHNPQLVDISSIWSPLTYCPTGASGLRTLIPWLFRRYEPSRLSAI